VRTHVAKYLEGIYVQLKHIGDSQNGDGQQVAPVGAGDAPLRGRDRLF